MKKVLVLILSMSVGVCFAQSRSTSQASRKTAERCLKLAENYLLNEDYTSAVSQAELGLAYDDSISDFYYIIASGKKIGGEKTAAVISYVRTAYEKNNWVGYNEKGNRILLADLLSDTGNYESSLGILDEKPFIYSSDAEAIRIKTLYRMDTEESLILAREKINSARRIYKDDFRFHQLFYSFEAARVMAGFEPDPLVLDMAQVLSSELRTLITNKKTDRISEELECLYMFFEDGEQLIRDAKAFYAENKKNSLFPVIALKAGIMPETLVVDMFWQYAEDSTNFETLLYFESLLTDEEAKLKLRENFRLYNGTLFSDVNRDLQWEMKIEYKNGRPQQIAYDENNDGDIDLAASLDYGEVLSVTYGNGNRKIEYDAYPFIGYAEDHVGINDTTEIIVYEFAKNTMEKEVFDFEKPSGLQLDEKNGFYVPIVKENWKTEDFNFIEEAAFIKCSTKERPEGQITYSLLEGRFVSAVFTQNGIAYGALDFVDGIPALRNVDYDGNGIFETVEYFDSYTEDLKDGFSDEDSQAVENIFGNDIYSLLFSEKVYISKIEIDYNDDTVPDFTEVYEPYGGKMTLWDLDNDKDPERIFIRYPAKDDEPVIEEAVFRTGIAEDLVSVVTSEGKPVSVKFNESEYEIIPGLSETFYWIETRGPEQAEIAFSRAVKNIENGNLVSLSFEDDDYFVVKVAGTVYAKKIHKIYFDENELADVLDAENNTDNLEAEDYGE